MHYHSFRPQSDNTYLTEGIPLTLNERGLVVMVTNTNVKHNVGAGEYEKRRDRCYAACKKLNVQSLRDVHCLGDIESKNL